MAFKMNYKKGKGFPFKTSPTKAYKDMDKYSDEDDAVKFGSTEGASTSGSLPKNPLKQGMGVLDKISTFDQALSNWKGPFGEIKLMDEYERLKEHKRRKMRQEKRKRERAEDMARNK